MRQTIKVLYIGMQIALRDAIMLLLIPAPLFIGILFKISAPLLNNLFLERMEFSISQYYPFVDGVLIALTPVIMTISCAFLLLEECDEGISAYYQITPAGKPYYLLARIGIPALWGFVNSILVVLLFGVSQMPLHITVAASYLSALSGIAIALMIVSISDNRVEGLAASKLAGISLLGLIGSWFAPGVWKWICAAMPSYWLGEISLGKPIPFNVLAGTVVTLLWIGIFARKFKNKTFQA